MYTLSMNSVHNYAPGEQHLQRLRGVQNRFTVIIYLTVFIYALSHARSANMQPIAIDAVWSACVC